MAINVETLVAEAEAKRAEAQAQADAARKVADAQKATNKAAKNIITKANVSLGYAKNLEPTIKNFEGTIRLYATRLSRGDKLSPTDQKEFDRVVKEYEKVNAAYNKALAEGNKILASIPKGAEPGIKPIIKDGGQNTFQLSPDAGTPAKLETPAPLTVEEVNKQIDTQIKDSRQFLLQMSGPERKAFAQTLKDAGADITPTEAFQDSVLLTYQGILQTAKAQNTNNKEFLPPVSFTEFITQKTQLANELKGLGGIGGRAGGSTTSKSISAPTEAAGLIQPIVKSLLGRDATAKEIKDLTARLVKAEKDPKNAVKTTTDANGNVVYTGGIDRNQFITDIIKTAPEFVAKKADKATITSQELVTTANSNGIKLSPDQLNGWVKEVENGGDVNVIKNKIRTIASMGQPDSVKKLMAEGTDLEVLYSPYKQRMASSLGVNVNTITLDDPTLRMAIGPDKEMSLYEFSKAIRKDNRWKYSEEANNEVTSMIDQVKRDFGFMG